MRCTAMVMAVVALCGVSAIAEGLPNDTNEIRSLNPQQARSLIIKAEGGFLSLGGLTTLDADTAKVLAGFKGKWLDLSGLTTIDVATAKVLANWKGHNLGLYQLSKLDAEAMAALRANPRIDLPNVR